MIAPDDYRFLSDALRKHSGLSLGDGKEYLLDSRLTPVAASFGKPDLPSLVRALRAGTDAALLKAVCEAMTTNETLFFRDQTPFRVLRETVLPSLAAARLAQRQKLRIWSAAASTGQEAYSIAILLAQMERQLQGVEFEILGTDYSSEALARARAGIYNQFEVQRGLPVQVLVQFFTQTATGFELSPEIRRRVTFREGNLLQPFSNLGQFDIIFCRNVLIYFDTDTKRDVMNRLAKALTRGGHLFLGGTETPFGITDRIVRAPGANTGVYIRSDDAGQRGAEAPPASVAPRPSASLA
jgi:chemotaxis protein methyltransferase CheR